ncbi:MAG: tautomerase family protein [Deltaproteobacteria bacterium]|nr:tautomerase family protein [Deltaproteobacteria bacterium]
MPLVTVQAVEGVFSAAQKRKIIEQLTETMVAIEGESLRPYTWVKVEEVKEGDWGIGGKILTCDVVRKLGAAEA